MSAKTEAAIKKVKSGFESVLEGLEDVELEGFENFGAQLDTLEEEIIDAIEEHRDA